MVFTQTATTTYNHHNEVSASMAVHTSVVVLQGGSVRLLHRLHSAGSALDRDLSCSRRAAPSAVRGLGVSFSSPPVTRSGQRRSYEAFATRQTHQEALAPASASSVQPSLASRPLGCTRFDLRVPIGFVFTTVMVR